MKLNSHEEIFNFDLITSDNVNKTVLIEFHNGKFHRCYTNLYGVEYSIRKRDTLSIMSAIDKKITEIESKKT